MTWLELSGAGAALAYLAAGVFTAARKIDWRGKVFFVGWLPLPPEMNDPSANRRVASAMLIVVVVGLWPLYRLAWRHERRRNGGEAPGGDEESRGAGGGGSDRRTRGPNG